jgi:hypothetical protein
MTSDGLYESDDVAIEEVSSCYEQFSPRIYLWLDGRENGTEQDQTRVEQ